MALSAVLFQLDGDGNPYPIIYSSCTLKGAELAYYTTEKELLAIVWVLHKFRSYIMGGKIIIRTNQIILYALKRRPSSSLRNRVQNFTQEQKLDPILRQKIKDVEEKKPTKYEQHDK